MMSDETNLADLLALNLHEFEEEVQTYICIRSNENDSIIMYCISFITPSLQMGIITSNFSKHCICAA